MDILILVNQCCALVSNKIIYNIHASRHNKILDMIKRNFSKVEGKI